MSRGSGPSEVVRNSQLLLWLRALHLVALESGDTAGCTVVESKLRLLFRWLLICIRGAAAHESWSPSRPFSQLHLVAMQRHALQRRWMRCWSFGTHSMTHVTEYSPTGTTPETTSIAAPGRGSHARTALWWCWIWRGHRGQAQTR